MDLSAEVAGLSANTGYRWRLRVRASNPYFPSTPWLYHSFNGATLLDLSTAGGVSTVGGQDAPPTAVVRLGNYPNPFNPQTVVRFVVDTAGPVSLRIYDARGLLVRSLVNEELPAGERVVVWRGDDDDGRRLASGLYIARLETRDGSTTHKLSLLK